MKYIDLIIKEPDKKINQKDYSDFIKEITSNNYENLNKFTEFYKNLNANK